MAKNSIRIPNLLKDRMSGKYNVKPPKIGGGMGIKPPALIAKALGVSKGMPIHAASVKGLTDHPNADVAKAAKKLLKRF